MKDPTDRRVFLQRAMNLAGVPLLALPPPATERLQAAQRVTSSRTPAATIEQALTEKLLPLVEWTFTLARRLNKRYGRLGPCVEAELWRLFHAHSAEIHLGEVLDRKGNGAILCHSTFNGRPQSVVIFDSNPKHPMACQLAFALWAHYRHVDDLPVPEPRGVVDDLNLMLAVIFQAALCGVTADAVLRIPGGRFADVEKAREYGRELARAVRGEAHPEAALLARLHGIVEVKKNKPTDLVTAVLNVPDCGTRTLWQKDAPLIEGIAHALICWAYPMYDPRIHGYSGMCAASDQAQKRNQPLIVAFVAGWQEVFPPAETSALTREARTYGTEWRRRLEIAGDPTPEHLEYIAARQMGLTMDPPEGSFANTLYRTADGVLAVFTESIRSSRREVELLAWAIVATEYRDAPGVWFVPDRMPEGGNRKEWAANCTAREMAAGRVKKQLTQAFLSGLAAREWPQEGSV